METEIWKPIIGYEGLYEISSIGRVKSLNYSRTGKERVLRGGTTAKIYKMYLIRKNNKSIPVTSHRLVGMHFIENPDNLPCVCHRIETLDENGLLYNGVDNLFWGTHKENMQDMVNKGRGNFQLNNPNKGKLGKYNHLYIKVNQYTKVGEFIREWESMTDIEIELGIFASSISMCCKGKRKTAGGFIWKYK